LDLSLELHRTGGVCNVADSEATIVSFQREVGDEVARVIKAGASSASPNWVNTPI
jgi:hypothetical protein